MHIGVLTHNYPRFSGDFSGNFVAALCEEFARQDHRVTVWAPYDRAYNRSLTEPVTLRLYRYAWPARLHRLGYMRSMQSDLALRLEAYALSPAMFAAGINAVTRDARRQRPDVLHAHWVLPNGFIAANASRRLGIPLAVSVPGSDAQVAAANPLFQRMARFAFDQAGLLTANSADLRDAVIDLGADPAKFDLIFYGTDPNKMRPSDQGVVALRESLQIPADAVVLLGVGRMVHKKGFDLLIRAAAQEALASQGVVLVLVGEGDQLAEWKSLAAALGVADQVRWVGTVPFDQIPVYYNMADVLVNPAVRKPADGLNVCVLDAMSCAKPVVGTAVAGNPLAIEHGVTGFITSEGDVAALASALATLAADPALRTEMGAAARRRVDEELGWPQLARRYLDHFARMQRGP
jgi:glycosyltransferase involved in cell wall biosynthesis